MPSFVHASLTEQDDWKNVAPRRPETYLQWEWVMDYYHACEYNSKLAQAIFGPGREAYAWAAKMRRTLKEKRGGHRPLIQKLQHLTIFQASHATQIYSSNHLC